MGVYVRGMKMPKNCRHCDFNYDTILCKATGIYFESNGNGGFDQYDKILDNCPLVHIPKHGRLIDEDALKEKRWDAETRVGYVQVVDMSDIDATPTIIPASISEEGKG